MVMEKMNLKNKTRSKESMQIKTEAGKLEGKSENRVKGVAD